MNVTIDLKKKNPDYSEVRIIQVRINRSTLYSFPTLGVSHAIVHVPVQTLKIGSLHLNC